MIWRIIAVAAILALVVAPPAKVGFWGDIKQSFGAAVDNAQRDGAEAVDAVSREAGDAADAVVEFVTGDTTNADSQPVDNTDQPATDGSKQLSKQSKI